jgi:hypothetical protein
VYVNGKMRPIETIPGMGLEGEIKKNNGEMNSRMTYLIYF